jgi:hypothetical protein
MRRAQHDESLLTLTLPQKERDDLRAHAVLKLLKKNCRQSISRGTSAEQKAGRNQNFEIMQHASVKAESSSDRCKIDDFHALCWTAGA